jgi:TonB family protein
LKQAILQSIEEHPVTTGPLRKKVRFNLAPNGSITGAVGTSGSGDAVFDRKVVEGIRRLKRYGKPPKLTGNESLTMTVKPLD